MQAKGWGWVLLLFLLGSRTSSARSAPAYRPPPQPRPPPPAPPPRAAPGAPAPAPGHRSPYPPQPEPSDDDLQLDPGSPLYPAHADLIWIQYAQQAGRPGPSLTDLDFTAGSGPRDLTEFERWAIERFIPPEYPRAVYATIKSDTAGVGRFQRWSLQRAARAVVLSYGAPLDVADRVLMAAARGLYEQARDFYRRAPP